jgi:hypothetical protein
VVAIRVSGTFLRFDNDVIVVDIEERHGTKASPGTFGPNTFHELEGAF